jgi:hypothetical protein
MKITKDIIVVRSITIMTPMLVVMDENKGRNTLIG